MLIKANEVIAIVFKSKKVDEALIENSIPLAERKYIKKVLGATLYNLLVSENDNQTFTGNNKTLLNDYIQPALAYYVTAEALPSFSAELTANGFNKNVPLGTEPASEADYTRHVSQYLSNAELYINDAKEYMNDNNISYSGKTISNKTLPFIY